MSQSTRAGSLPPINFAALADALLARAPSLVPEWLPGGVVAGHEYKCGSLSGGGGDSCSVNLTSGKWADFATDERGSDLLSLWGAMHGVRGFEAARSVAKAYGLEDVAGLVHTASGAAVERRVLPQPVAKPADKAREAWRTVVPVPDYAPVPTFRHYARAVEDIAHTAHYVIDGVLYGYVVRFRTSSGGKDTLPLTWCTSERDGSQKWCWRSWDGDQRPLYFPGRASPKPGQTVVLVEGERKADILQACLDQGVYVVASWVGGCKAWQRADFSPLFGHDVLLWPDRDLKRESLTAAERKVCGNDAQALEAAKAAKALLPALEQPGMVAMLGIGRKFARPEPGTPVRPAGFDAMVLPVYKDGAPWASERPDGWDCADAIKTDGWMRDDVLAFFARAQALPQEHADAPRDGPVGTGGASGAGAAVAAGGGGKRGKPAHGSGGDDGDMPDWLRPFYDTDKGRWAVSRKLVIAALQHDEALAGVLATNDLTNGIQAMRPWPWPDGKPGELTDSTDLMLGQYLTDTYGLPSVARMALSEAIQTVAAQHHYHPVRDYLQGLKWDKQARLDTWLIDALGEIDSGDGPRMPGDLPGPLARYLRLVGRFWLLGMVARVMEPGCKFDYCPVLEGAGGLRKSTLCEVLAGSTFYSDTPFQIGQGKEAQEQVAGLWLYEIAELTNFSRPEVGAIKAFISSKVDRYRVAYGRTVQSFPRQCVMVGTTNESTYFRDRTGNRRLWPVPVKKVIGTEWVAQVRDQLFAEALHRYREGERYAPSGQEERELFEPMQAARLIETAVTSDLMRVLTRDSSGGLGGPAAKVNALADFVTIAELVAALGVDTGKSSPALEAQIRSWLEYQGWQHCKRQINKVRQHGYVRPQNWPFEVASDADWVSAQAEDLGSLRPDLQPYD